MEGGEGGSLEESWWGKTVLESVAAQAVFYTLWLSPARPIISPILSVSKGCSRNEFYAFLRALRMVRILDEGAWELPVHKRVSWRP